MEEKYKSERDHAKTRFLEVQGLEQTFKADIEQMTKRVRKGFLHLTGAEGVVVTQNI